MFESSNGDFDIQKKHLSGNGTYVVSSGETNLGVIGKTNVNGKVFDKNTITIDMFGSAHFRGYEYRMVTHARVFSLKLLDKQEVLNDKSGLYCVIQANYLKHIFGYNNMASWEKIKNKKLSLPVIPNTNQINWKHIETYIRAIQKLTIKDVVKFSVSQINTVNKIISLKH